MTALLFLIAFPFCISLLALLLPPGHAIKKVIGTIANAVRAFRPRPVVKSTGPV